MTPSPGLLETVLQLVLDVARGWANERWARCREVAIQAAQRELQRVFDGLLLLGLGLILSALSLTGLAMLLWSVLPEPMRAGVMAAVLLVLGALGAGLLQAARGRLARHPLRGSGPAAGANRGPSP